MKQLLDYPHADIWMHVDTEVERTKRINACAKEAETIAWIESMLSGEVFFDIGACVGSYSLLAASRGLKVWAFEPAPFNLKRISANARLNGLSVEMWLCAVSDQIGRCDMEWSSEEPGSALHHMVEGDGVQMITVDDFCEWETVTPDHVKIDVDGSELKVIQGGRETWPTVKSVQVEIDDSIAGWEEIPSLLSEAGLEMTTWTRHGETSISNVLFRR